MVVRFADSSARMPIPRLPLVSSRRAAASPLVAALDSLLRSSVIMKTRMWGSTFMYLPSSLSLANESWDLLTSPTSIFPVTNLDSRPSPSPSPSPVSCLLFAPPAQAYTRSLPRVQKGSSAQPCIARSRPRARTHPLPYPAPPPGVHRPCLRAPPRLLIPRCAPTAHGPSSNRSMPQKPSRKAIIINCFRNPRRPPCVACLASPCGRGAVPLQAWPSRGQRSTSPPSQYVFFLHAALRT